jgi:fructose-1,6-bisphosphatase/sedoheptulose 1,7-bisphosphatase-like protein
VGSVSFFQRWARIARSKPLFFGAGKRTHSVVMTTDSKCIRFVDTVHVEGGPDAVIRF